MNMANDFGFGFDTVAGPRPQMLDGQAMDFIANHPSEQLMFILID